MPSLRSCDVHSRDSLIDDEVFLSHRYVCHGTFSVYMNDIGRFSATNSP